jgi:RNA polymerase sigma factor (sigma-70 family)
MTNRLWATAIERAGVLTAPLALDELPDSDLVRRFLASREEQAFAAIVRRHGPLVWGVCRNLLPSEADAEDAFQATFLALVKSAPRIQRPNALGAWLHRVAGRVCRHSLRSLARRRKHEQSAAIEEAARPVDEATWDRWQAAVHEEIDRLPDTLRVPFVLCVLQGLRQPEAAKRLGWKLGTVSGRVCKAKQALADAVTRRGLAGAAVLTAVVGGSAPLSAGLAALGRAVNPSGSRLGDGVSPTVHELARGAMGGLMSKSKLLAAAIVAGTMAIGVGTSVLSTAGAQTSGSSDTTPTGAGPGQQPGGLGLPGPGGPGGFAPGGGGPGGATAGMAPGGGGGVMMGSAARGPRVEYQFVARPKASDAFKKLLNQHGSDGWEYVGPVPGDDELIFKRIRPSGGIMSGGGMGMGGGGGFGGGMGMPGMGGFGTSGTGGFGNNPFGGPKGASGSSSGAAPKTGGGTRPAGGGDTTPGEAGAGGPIPPKGQATIALRVGETIRYKMASQKEIDRVFSHESRVADANPDPTDAKRVLLKGLAPGGSRLELTDTNGVKEEYTIRVR